MLYKIKLLVLLKRQCLLGSCFYLLVVRECAVPRQMTWILSHRWVFFSSQMEAGLYSMFCKGITNGKQMTHKQEAVKLRWDLTFCLQLQCSFLPALSCLLLCVFPCQPATPTSPVLQSQLQLITHSFQVLFPSICLSGFVPWLIYRKEP